MYRTTALALVIATSLVACADATSPTPASATRSPDRPSLAQANVQHINEQYEIAGYTQFNPCTGELITYSGRYHVNGTITTTENGEDVKIHLNTEDFKGVSSTGTEYIYHQQTHQADEFTYDPFTETYVSRVTFMNVSQGPTDNYRYEEVYTFTYPPGNSQFTIEEKCTG
jgi:hypothetical protein